MKSDEEKSMGTTTSAGELECRVLLRRELLAAALRSAKANNAHDAAMLVSAYMNLNGG